MKYCGAMDCWPLFFLRRDSLSPAKKVGRIWSRLLSNRNDDTSLGFKSANGKLHRTVSRLHVRQLRVDLIRPRTHQPTKAHSRHLAANSRGNGVDKGCHVDQLISRLMWIRVAEPGAIKLHYFSGLCGSCTRNLAGRTDYRAIRSHYGGIGGAAGDDRKREQVRAAGY